MARRTKARSGSSRKKKSKTRAKVKKTKRKKAKPKKPKQAGKRAKARGTRKARKQKKAKLLSSFAPAEVKVARSVAGGAVLGAKLNDQDLVFSGDVATAQSVAGKTDNVLDWAVVGPPGASYSIEITKPAGTECGEKNITLDNSGKGGGSCQFAT